MASRHRKFRQGGLNYQCRDLLLELDLPISLMHYKGMNPTLRESYRQSIVTANQ
jgi:hypothetical protein